MTSGGPIRIVVSGVVTDLLTAGPLSGAVACLARGHVVLVSGAVGPDGRFELVVDGGEPGRHHVLVFADGREAARRRVEAAADLRLELGEVVLVPVELAPGVHGTLWDETVEGSVAGGRAALTAEGGEQVGVVRADLDGRFEIAMSCRRPIPPGRYVLEAEAPGFQPAQVRFVVDESRTVVELGRIELQPDRAESGNGGAS